MIYQTWLIYGGLDLDHTDKLLSNGHVTQEVKVDMYRYKINHNALVSPDHVRTPALKKHEPDTRSGDAKVWQEVKHIFLDPQFCPLMADDSLLSKTSRCYIMTAGYDVIRDDGLMYYKRLINSGVKATLRNYNDAFHNSLTFHSGPLKLAGGEQILLDIVDFLKEHL